MRQPVRVQALEFQSAFMPDLSVGAFFLEMPLVFLLLTRYLSLVTHGSWVAVLTCLAAEFFLFLTFSALGLRLFRM
jgi:hypothetical protein